MKSLMRRYAYLSGVMNLHHRWCNSKNLTVVMFHRVLPVHDLRWATAETTYTVSEVLFDECLSFFTRHYSPVTLAQVRTARNAGSALPPNPILVTFDDGWLDNLTTALPILEKYQVPAVIFVAASVIDDPSDIWWHDLVVNGWNTGTLTGEAFADFREAIGLAAAEERGWRSGVDVLDVLLAAGQLDYSVRDSFLQPLKRANYFAPPRQMLDQHGLEQLASHHLIEIGAHSYSHLPLTRMQQPHEELAKSKQRLEQIGGIRASGGIRCMSFPHGRYDSLLVEKALNLGFELVFTSDAVLNRIATRPQAVLGRIGIPSSQITSAAGMFSADRLATWLFTRTPNQLAAT